MLNAPEANVSMFDLPHSIGLLYHPRTHQWPLGQGTFGNTSIKPITSWFVSFKQKKLSHCQTYLALVIEDSIPNCHYF